MTQCIKMAVPLFQTVVVTDVRRLSAHGRARCLQARRHFGVSCGLTAKVPPPRKPRERVEIPGLEMITYGEKMHYVPGLAKPVYAHWEKDYKDPRYYKAPPAHEMPLHKEKPCYVYHQRTSALEGSQQYITVCFFKSSSEMPGLGSHIKHHNVLALYRVVTVATVGMTMGN